MRILGFPYDLDMPLPQGLNEGYPFPLTKGAVCSGLLPGHNGMILLDCYNNRGLSGGPVVYYPAKYPANITVAGHNFRIPQCCESCTR